jgi:hypothetical protein
MAIVFNVETGAGSATGTSYITVAELTQFLEDAGLTITLTTDDQKQAALNRMTVVLDSFAKWPGVRAVDGQALEWPRSGAYYNDGISISNTVIPAEIKKALAYFVYYSNAGTDVVPVREGANLKSESSEVVGAVKESKEYWYSGKITPEIAEIKMILRRLLKKSSMSLDLRR